MIRTLIAFSAALCVASPALADPDTDYPHRDWGQVATLDMTLMDATACIARTLDRRGDAIVIPAEGGNDIDFAVRPAWGPKMEPWLSFKLREEGSATQLRIFYRRPMSRGKVANEVERLRKRCLMVSSITPSTDVNPPNQ